MTITVDASAARAIVSDILKCSDTTALLMVLLGQRDAKGLASYGKTLDRTDLTATDWLQHMTEELLDGAGYAQAAKREIEKLLAIKAAAEEAIASHDPKTGDISLGALMDALDQ